MTKITASSLLLKLAVLSRFCERSGISLRQLCILSMLEKAPMPPGEIATELAITPAAITSQANVLTSKGYVGYSDSATDGRQRPLCITKDGRKLVSTADAMLLQTTD